MATSSSCSEPRTRHPASLYRLQVAGPIPDAWEGRLGCLRVVHEEGTKPHTTTTLMGAVTDQAELLGILNTLHELRLDLLLVEALNVQSILNLSEDMESTKPTKTK